MLERQGFCLRFYEDYPYVRDGHELVRALALPHPAGWAAELVVLQEPHVAAKCEAIACHASQIPVFFGDVAHMIQAVRSHMALVAGSAGFGERFWRSGCLATPRPQGAH
jgi:LmbE family N-acetylglucosaminyl deacetylase